MVRKDAGVAGPEETTGLGLTEALGRFEMVGVGTMTWLGGAV
jgi:hypothetical protein